MSVCCWYMHNTAGIRNCCTSMICVCWEGCTALLDMLYLVQEQYQYWILLLYSSNKNNVHISSHLFWAAVFVYIHTSTYTRAYRVVVLVLVHGSPAEVGLLHRWHGRRAEGEGHTSTSTSTGLFLSQGFSRLLPSSACESKSVYSSTHIQQHTCHMLLLFEEIQALHPHTGRCRRVGKATRAPTEPVYCCSSSPV